jgi:hypothetical protein
MNIKQIPALSIIIVGLIAWPVLSKTLVVPKDYEDIETAIEKANGGDTVFVTNGTYNEQLVMRDSIILIGEDMLKTVIFGDMNHPVIKGADFSRVENLTIREGGTGILCDNKRMIIEKCFITENKQTGIHCLINLPLIRNCIISRCKWTGVFCESVQSFKFAFEHNVLGENGYCGLMLAGKSNILVQNNVFYNNRQYGLWVGQEARKSRIVHNCLANNRTSFNNYAVVNNTNIATDPGFAPKAPNTYDYTPLDIGPLKGMGTEESSIGLTAEKIVRKTGPDSDADGIPDEIDKCPGIPEDYNGVEDKDGCPDFGNDSSKTAR